MRSLRQTFDCPVCYCHDKIRPASMGAKMRKAGWFCRAFIVKSEAIRTHKRPKANGSDMKQKKCKAKGCGVVFSPARPMQCVCSPACAQLLARAKTEQAETKQRQEQRKADRAKREELKPLKWFHSKTKIAVHKYIRTRDAEAPCISCGTHHAAQWDAGHFISVGSDSSLRYDFANIHKQCSVCNQHKSGNLLRYRANLIQKIGEAEVLRLEGPQPVHKWTREELAAIEAVAKRLIKELEKA